MRLKTAILATFLIASSLGCPDGGREGPNGMCYRAFTNSLTWYDAQWACQELDGNLAAIPDDKTNLFMVGFSAISFNYSDAYLEPWLGGIPSLKARKWYWIDEETSFNYTNWQSAPNNTGGYCLVQSADGKWKTKLCSSARPYICQFNNPNPAQDPCPSTAPTAPIPECPTTPAPSTCPPATNELFPCPSKEWFYSYETMKCYRFVVDSVNWTVADNACRNTFDASLAKIRSERENYLIGHYFYIDHSKNDKYWLWIGMKGKSKTNNNVSTDYQWVDGTPLDYTRWTDSFVNRDECVHYNTADNSTIQNSARIWHPDPCNTVDCKGCSDPKPQFGYICEIVVKKMTQYKMAELRVLSKNSIGDNEVVH